MRITPVLIYSKHKVTKTSHCKSSELFVDVCDLSIEVVLSIENISTAIENDCDLFIA